MQAIAKAPCRSSPLQFPLLIGSHIPILLILFRPHLPQFHHPVYVGDEVSVFAELVRSGRTSMTIEVEAWRRDRFGEKHEKVTQASFVFVAIDEQGKPRAVELETSNLPKEL